MQVTIFLPPNGEQRVVECTDIAVEDEQWFVANHVKISMEELRGGAITVYADVGRKNEDGEVDEVIVFDNGRSCMETMAELRIVCEKVLLEKDQWPNQKG